MPNSYSDFSLEDVEEIFGLQVEEKISLFSSVPSMEIGNTLSETLKRNIPLAIAIHTEKARSEFIIAPLLAELYHRMSDRISLFSGVKFVVEPDKGLTGTCDFLISLSCEQRVIKAPIIAIVEAKNDNIKDGIGQCIAEMVAAQIFNQKKQNKLKTLYGLVTTGSLWHFINLEEKKVCIDIEEYYIKDVEKIFGILLYILGAKVCDII